MPEGPELPASIARRHFHWCLASVILPVISLPVEWALALADRSASGAMPEERRWSHWLIGLALVDTMVAALVIALVASGVWGWHTLTERRSQPRPGEAVRIGVTIVTNPERPDEPQIGRVETNSPAERAGLQAGDGLLAVDGTPIRKVEDLPSMIRSGTPGATRTVRIRRAGEETEIVVTPELRRAIREPAGALLDAAPTPSCLADAVGYVQTLSRWRGAWVAAFLVTLLWLVGLRAQPRAPRLWSWAVAALGGVVLAGPLAWWGVCIGVGGRSVGGTLAAELAQPTVLLLVGLMAMRQMTDAGLLGARIEPVLGARRAVMLGFFYLVAVNVRVNIFTAALEAFGHVHLSAVAADGSVAYGFAALGWPGRALLTLTVVGAVPVAEEVLFRGVILPRLAPWMGAAWAIVASSAVFAVLHEGFGNEPFGLRAADAFESALIQGWARLRTGGLTAPITMHIVNNACALLSRW